MTQLTEHFTLEEMCVTSHREIDNTPPIDVIDALKCTARGMEHVRLLLGVPILVNSGYRSPVLNNEVGGSAGSQHMRGEACDFIAPKYGTPFEICKVLEASDLRFDQMIYEGNWVHVSFVDYRTPRRSIMTWQRGKGYMPGLTEGATP
jgi:hypothetical protein